MAHLLTLSAKDFILQVAKLGIRKTYFASVNGELIGAHPALQELTDFISSSPDFSSHEGVFLEFDPETLCVYGAFIHKTVRGASQGGTRLKQYHNAKAVLTDGLRLAEGMTLKNACADIWWGGGKGIIWCVDQPRSIHGNMRKQIFSSYGRFVASLNGSYITAEDMNTSPEDMRVIHANNRHCTCIPVEIGGSSNPSTFTARGVFQGMRAAVDARFGEDNGFAGKHVLLQGAGNVGYPLLEEIIRNGGKVTVFDVNEDILKKLKERFVESQLCIERDYDKFLEIEADIFSPNAIGGIVNEQSIEKLKVSIIAGGANNQLRDPEKHSEMLRENGILYAPDFIINCMGIINCANEQYGYLLENIEEEVEKVYVRTKEILDKALSGNRSPYAVAMELAKQKSNFEHPIWGHRSKRIIRELIKKKWEKIN